MLINKKIEQSSFLFYDYETFGINPALDRPAQFAVIRTDNTLQTIKKKEVFFCRPATDYFPDPKSTLITGITPQYTLRNGLIEPEFARRIYQLFHTPQTCVLGYNNIHFDDEFTRNIFYRNFYDPYTWAYQQGNSRWDLLHILRAYYTLYPHGIIWPFNDKNQPSFRLKDITRANSIEHVSVHNATSDIFATLELTKLVKKAQPQLFQFLFNYRTKYQLQKIINLDDVQPLVFITRKINNQCKSFINYIAPITWYPENPNILIACDLNKNIDILFNLNIDTIYQKLHSNTTTIYDITKNIPLHLIRLNACPILIPISFVNEINSKYTQNSDNYQYCLKNLNFFRNHKNSIHLRNKIKTLYTTIIRYIHSKNWNNNAHVDSQLYNKFFNNADRKIIEKIPQATAQELTKLCTKNLDKRLTPLLFYYRARNFPHTLSLQEQQIWMSYRQNKLFSKNQSRYYNHTLNEFLSIYKNRQPQTKLLQSLQQYYQYLYNIKI